jgi:NADP-dependent 3-hydroxy acid dehydrogenase YdfG
MLLNRLITGSSADMLKAAAIELHEAGVPVVL